MRRSARSAESESPIPSPVKGRSKDRSRTLGHVGGTPFSIPVAAVLVFATVYLWRQNQIFDQQLALLRATVQEQQDQFRRRRAKSPI